jgi:hypothetical protein
MYDCIRVHESSNLNRVDFFMCGFTFCDVPSGANPPPHLTKTAWHETLHFMCRPRAISKKDVSQLLDGVQITAVNVKASIIYALKTVVSLHQWACYKTAEPLVNTYQITGRHFPTYGAPQKQTAALCHTHCLQLLRTVYEPILRITTKTKSTSFY